jgi:hypothetical protein
MELQGAGARPGLHKNKGPGTPRASTRAFWAPPGMRHARGSRDTTCFCHGLGRPVAWYLPTHLGREFPWVAPLGLIRAHPRYSAGFVVAKAHHLKTPAGRSEAKTSTRPNILGNCFTGVFELPCSPASTIWALTGTLLRLRSCAPALRQPWQPR